MTELNKLCNELREKNSLLEVEIRRKIDIRREVEYRIAAVTIGPSIKDIGPLTVSLPQSKPILQNELDAAFLGMALAYNNSKTLHRIRLQIFIDNNAVISFISRGRAKWSWSFFAHARALFRLHTLRQLFFRLNPCYETSRRRPPGRKHAYPHGVEVTLLTTLLKIYFSTLLESQRGQGRVLVNTLFFNFLV